MLHLIYHYFYHHTVHRLYHWTTNKKSNYTCNFFTISHTRYTIFDYSIILVASTVTTPKKTSPTPTTESFLFSFS